MGLIFLEGLGLQSRLVLPLFLECLPAVGVDFPPSACTTCCSPWTIEPPLKLLLDLLDPDETLDALDIDLESRPLGTWEVSRRLDTDRLRLPRCFV